MGIENLKDKYFPVLDHGFCAVVDSMGDDHSIARAARCSYGAGTKTVSDDRGLIRTLMRDMHTSPFEMCEVVLHVGLPIFVARQWVRHRTASLNEYSGRYSVMPALFYEPTRERHTLQNPVNKQGSSEQQISGASYRSISGARDSLRYDAYALYDECLEADLAREISRIDLPLSTYTYWYWKIDLKNLLHFLRLRLDAHAQWEIRQYAKIIAGVVQEWLPITWEAFDDYIMNGVTFSRQEQRLLLDAIQHGGDPTSVQLRHILEKECHGMGMSVRETKAFFTKLEFLGGQFTEDVALDHSLAKTPEHYHNMIQAAAEFQGK